MAFYLVAFALVMAVISAYVLFGWLGALWAIAFIVIGWNLDDIVKWWKGRK
jgi:hypothetical protein